MFHSVKLIREQKEEYMDHLFDVLYESTYKLFKMMYLSVMNEKEILKSFQKEIARIPEWNKLKVEAAYKDFLSTSKCTYFPDLLKTIYILSIKMVLLGIPSEKRNKIKIKIPDPETFCHRLWIHIARDVWKRPYLFYHQVKTIEQQNHLYQFETIIRRKIRSVIRDTIPMELMVQQLSNSDILAEEDKDSDSEGTVGTEDESKEEESEEEGSDESEAVGSETSEAEDKDDSLSDDDESETEEEGSEVSETIGTVDKDESLSEDDKSSTDGEESDEFKEEETVGVDKDESSSEDEPEEVGVDSEVSDTEDKELETSEAVVGEDKDSSLSNDGLDAIERDLSLLGEEGLETSEPIKLETPKANEEEIPLIQDTPVTIYEEPKKKLIHIQELMKHKKKHRSKDRFF